MDAAELDQIVEAAVRAFVHATLDLAPSDDDPGATMSQNGAGGSFAVARPMLEAHHCGAGRSRLRDVPPRSSMITPCVGEHRVVSRRRYRSGREPRVVRVRRRVDAGDHLASDESRPSRRPVTFG